MFPKQPPFKHGLEGWLFLCSSSQHKRGPPQIWRIELFYDAKLEFAKFALVTRLTNSLRSTRELFGNSNERLGCAPGMFRYDLGSACLQLSFDSQ